MRLENKVAIVAGGSKGLGKAVALALAREGASVAVVSRSRGAVDDAAAQARDHGARAVGIAADCTNGVQVTRMIDAVVQQLGAPDILVNTVGGGTPELLLNTTDELFDHMLSLNVRSTFLLSRAIAPILMGKGSGKIIHTASIGAKSPTPGLSVYDGCKAFVVAFTRDLAVELGRFGVNVNCVCPGHIPTEATREVGARLCAILELEPSRLQAMVASRAAIARVPGAEDLAGLYVFLASGAADCMTGQAINYSCGMEMR